MKVLTRFFLLGFFFVTIFTCQNIFNKQDKETTMRDINEVMKENTEKLMSIDGVVGLFIGQTKAGAPCIKVMVIEKNSTIENKIPKKLDGYQVIIHESGVIRPMDKK